MADKPIVQLTRSTDNVGGGEEEFYPKVYNNIINFGYLEQISDLEGLINNIDNVYKTKGTIVIYNDYIIKYRGNEVENFTNARYWDALNPTMEINLSYNDIIQRIYINDYNCIVSDDSNTDTYKICSTNSVFVYSGSIRLFNNIIMTVDDSTDGYTRYGLIPTSYTVSSSGSSYKLKYTDYNNKYTISIMSNNTGNGLSVSVEKNPT